MNHLQYWIESLTGTCFFVIEIDQVISSTAENFIQIIIKRKIVTTLNSEIESDGHKNLQLNANEPIHMDEIS